MNSLILIVLFNYLKKNDLIVYLETNIKKVKLSLSYLQAASVNDPFEIFNHLWGNLLENDIEIPKE